MIVFHLTPVGKQAIAGATIGDEIVLRSAIITDAESALTVSTPAQLSGTIVFNSVCEGYISGTEIHLEFLDDSENTYIAKTLALIFRKSGTDYVFALATSSDRLFTKTPSLLQAVIHVTYVDAESVTFDSANISFPPATTSRFGSVKLATQQQIEEKSGNGVVTASDLSSLNLDGVVDLTSNQSIGGTKTFIQTIGGTVQRAINDQNGNQIKTAANLDYVTEINESSSTLTTTIPNTNSVVGFVNTKVNGSLKLSEVGLQNNIGSMGLYFYSEVGNKAAIGSTVDGQYLKPVSITTSLGGDLAFTEDDSISLTGVWTLLTVAAQRTSSEKSVVFAIKTSES